MEMWLFVGLMILAEQRLKKRRLGNGPCRSLCPRPRRLFIQLSGGRVKPLKKRPGSDHHECRWWFSSISSSQGKNGRWRQKLRQIKQQLLSAEADFFPWDYLPDDGNGFHEDGDAVEPMVFTDELEPFEGDERQILSFSADPNGTVEVHYRNGEIETIFPNQPNLPVIKGSRHDPLRQELTRLFTKKTQPPTMGKFLPPEDENDPENIQDRFATSRVVPLSAH